MADADLAHVLDVAERAVRAAGAVARALPPEARTTSRKEDGSPVTEADPAAEAAARAVIEAAFPGHDLLAEEGGAVTRGSSCRWILDPLDGTAGYARGGASWGPILAFERDGEVVAGAAALPDLGRVYAAARGLGCRRDGVPVRVASPSCWADATVSLGAIRRLLLRPPHGSAVAALVAAARDVRAYGDVAACAMLLDGRADAWLEAGVQVWDVAGLRILVEEAGATFTDLAGRPSHETGEALAAAPHLHAEALALLRAHARAR